MACDNGMHETLRSNLDRWNMFTMEYEFVNRSDTMIRMY